MRTLCFVLALAACSRPAHPPPPARAARCDPGPALAEVEAMVRDGYLGRALRRVEAIPAACQTIAVREVRAGRLADLGLDARAAEAYRELASERDPELRARVSRALAELERRPPATASADPAAMRRARHHYLDGIALRLRGDHDRAVQALRASYAAWPHPLTIVQIGVTHRAAGDPAKARMAFARALAIAEESRGTRATPVIRLPHQGSVMAVAADPRGRRLVTSSVDQTIKLWDLVTGQLIRTFELGPATAVALSPDGATLAIGASATMPSKIILVDVTTGAVGRELEAHRFAVDALAWTGDGSRLISASENDRVAAVWDPETGDRVEEIEVGLGVRALEVSPDDGKLAVVGNDSIAVIDRATGDPVAAANLPRPEAIAWDRASGRLVTATRDRQIRTFAAADGAALETRAVAGDRKRFPMAVLAGATLVASTRADRYDVELLDLVTGETRVIGGGGHLIHSIAVDPGGDWVVSGGHPGESIIQWDLVRGTARRIGRAPGGARQVATDGRRVAAVSYRGAIDVWQLGEPVTAIEPPAEWADVVAAGFSPDGEILALARNKQPVIEWTPDAGSYRQLSVKSQLIAHLPSGELVTSETVPDLAPPVAVAGARQLIAGADGTLIDLDGGEPRRLTDRFVFGVAVDPSRRRAAFASEPEVALVDLAGGQPRLLRGHVGIVTSVGFLDDARLVSGGADQTLRIWNADSGAPMLTLAADDDADWVAVAPDGRVDGGPSADAAAALIGWRIGDVELPGFVGWQRQARAGLVRELAGSSR